jgi:aldose 1-epimerase
MSVGIPFGVLPNGAAVEMHTLANASGMEVRFIDLGGTICSLMVPDRDGNAIDITPGYDSLRAYREDTQYFGSLIGRFAGRISRSRFTVDGETYALSPNDGANFLHGGVNGFHRQLWSVAPFSAPGRTGVVLTHTSRDGEAGFPGALHVRVTYTLTDANELSFDYLATTNRATPVNLLQHFYMNLGGHDSGDILDHVLTIRATRYLPVSESLIPTGRLAPVAGTPFDFRSPRRIGDGEFDHTFALDGERIAARLAHPQSGRTVEIETTEPGLHLYTGGMLGPALHGKAGARYHKHGALALETQHFPDSPNVPSFPDTILRPGGEFISRTVYRFGTT